MAFSINERTYDTAEVGQLEQHRFKCGPVRQRVAVLPRYVPPEELIPDPALIQRAEAGDNEAIDLLDDLTNRQEAIDRGLKYRNPTVRVYKGGFLIFPTYSLATHYFKGLGNVICKTEQWRRDKLIKKSDLAACCRKIDPESGEAKKGELKEVSLVLVYDTDPDGAVKELTPAKQRRLDDTHRLWFDYSIQRLELRVRQVSEWKKCHANFPPLRSDYDIWKDPGQFDPWQFQATGESLWLALGETMIERVLDEAEEKRETIPMAFGKDYTDPAKMEADLLNLPPAAGSRPVANPRDFLK